MTLVNWSPLREFDDLFHRYGALPRRRLSADVNADNEGSAWRPVANISETSKAYVIKAELPEVAKEDVDVTVNEGVITIKGERRYERSADDETQHRIESFYGSFARSFNVPSDVDEAAIAAESKDGVLTVNLPKIEIEPPREIDIKVS